MPDAGALMQMPSCPTETPPYQMHPYRPNMIPMFLMYITYTRIVSISN